MKISHSSKDTYFECGFKYFLHYYRKLRPVDKASPLAFGDAIDVGLTFLLRTRDLQGAQVAFTNRWIEHKGGVKYSKSDLEEHLLDPDKIYKDDNEKTWDSLLQRGSIILEEYNSQIIPRIKEVIAVQIDTSMKNEEGDELAVKPDFIAIWEDGRRILFDNKTTSVKYEADSVNKSEQLGTYFEALKEEHKLDACGYIVIPKRINKKKKPAILINVIIDNVAEETIENTFKDYERALEGIKDGLFPKNHESCISKYGKCVYYEYCKNKSTKGLVE